MRGLAEGLKMNATLQELDLCIIFLDRLFLDDNAIQDEGAISLAEVLRGHKSIARVFIGKGGDYNN